MTRQLLSPYTKVLTVFIAFLFVFLVVVDMAVIRTDRRARIESVHEYVQEELELIGTYITESILRYDLSAVEQFIHQWGEKDPHVVSLTAITPQGRTLALYESGENPVRTVRIDHTMTYNGRHILDLVLVESLDEIYGEMSMMAYKLVVRSVFVVIVLGFISWLIFRAFAMKPLEREISLRKQAEAHLLQSKEGLEQAVRDRTEELESANIQLTSEIQERKTAVEMAETSLREKELLLQEIHHRVKNNLQVISGMLEIQRNRIGDNLISELLKASQYRIMSMALVHDELYRSRDLTRIDFSNYVRGLVKNLYNSYAQDPEKIRLHFLLEEVPLVVDTAIPCGLILTELITNAFKHAFPGKREGDITITFGKLDDNMFNLAVQDNGVGFPIELRPDRTSSLGLNLVNVLVELLHGDMKIRNNNGVRYEIRFPEYHEAGIGMY
jgi:two-component sensor histidine kinase